MTATKAAILEKAYLRLNVGRERPVQRHEIESWLEEGLFRAGRTVAAGPNFRLLQRRFSAQLGEYDRPIVFDAEQSYSNVGGWGSGVEIEGGKLTGTVDSFVWAAEMVEVQLGQPYHANQYLEFAYQGEKQAVSLGLVPVTLPVDALRPTHEMLGQAGVLFAVSVEQFGMDNPRVAAYYGGEPVLNPDLTIGLSVGDRIRVMFDATGAIRVQVYAATASVVKADYPVVDPTDSTKSLYLGENFVPVLFFHEDGAAVDGVRIGVVDPFLADFEDNIILDSIRARGAVKLEDGRVCGYVAGGEYVPGAPRIKGQWYWSDVNQRLRVWPSPVKRLKLQGGEIFRHDARRNAWVQLASLPAGVTLALRQIVINYDQNTLVMSTGRNLEIDTTKESVVLQFPALSADGAYIQVSATPSWAINPVTVEALGREVIYAAEPGARRVVYDANIIPTIEDIGAELVEPLISALLEIGVERLGSPAKKEKENQQGVSVPNVR